ncbi:phosphoribosylglycinamide formyltransferase [Desulfococcaceae bacterium HSG7]|nr:phosphoribosylglycinamide formyltransferase [Desulfococcaceae bacterium HSG7]
MPAKINKIRIGALLSGSGSNFKAIADACESGQIDGEIVFAGSDRPDAQGLEIAKKRSIPTFCVDYGSHIRRFKKKTEIIKFPNDADMTALIRKSTSLLNHYNPEQARFFLMTRAAIEAELLNEIDPYPFDLLVLAGFMRNLTPYFIDRINITPGKPRIMNIHPALLPAFPGTDGYGDTFRYGCKVGGCTVHFIDYGEDSGPIIGQKTFAISERDTIETIRAKGLKLEWQLYPQCVQLFAQKRLAVVNQSHCLRNGQIKNRAVVQIRSESQIKPKV